MNGKNETPIAGLFFCLVAFPTTEDGQHDVYVMPSDVIATVLSTDHGLWLSRPGRNGQTHRDNDVRVLLPDYRRSGEIAMQEYGEGWLEPFPQPLGPADQHAGSVMRRTARLHDFAPCAACA